MTSTTSTNPLVAALGPLPEDVKKLNALIARKPPIPTAVDRSAPMSKRFAAVSSIEGVYIPGARDLKAALSILTTIIRGYEVRLPRADYWAGHQAACEALPAYQANCTRAVTISDPTAVIGASGNGKTTLVNALFSSIPQVYSHDTNNPLLPRHQINWIKVNCPVNGTPRSFMTSFFSEMDRLLGGQFVAINKRVNDDERIIAMARLARTHILGMLIIDEVQNLASAPRRDERRLLKLIVNLSATLNIPILFVGTFKAQDLISREMADARRMLGPRWTRYDAEDPDWNRFLTELWAYQYTRTPTPLDDELKAKVYDLTQGIPALVKKLFCSAQEHLIFNTTDEDPETITVEVLQQAFDDNMAAVAPALDALRTGLGIDRYEDLMPKNPIDDMSDSALTGQSAEVIKQAYHKSRLNTARRLGKHDAIKAITQHSN